MPGRKKGSALGKRKPERFPVRLEYCFLFLFLVSRLWLFVAHKGEAIGWDVGVHLQMLSHWPWSPGMWDVQSEFYAYHPPVAFFLARVLHVMGIDTVTSVQAVAATASVIGFFFLRKSLQYLQVLRTWQGLLFLYITSTLPIQIYLARSINMDVIVYAEACAVVYFSLRVFFVKKFSLRKNHAIRNIALLILCLVLGLFTKYSGLLLLGIPCLLTLFSSESLPSMLSKKVFHRVLVACCICGVAVAMASPYYFQRYYRQTGQFFPTNMDLEKYDKNTAIAERAQRDKNPTEFLQQFFWRTSPDATRIQDRDQKTVRLLNTWKDIWSGNKHNVKQSGLSLALSNIYANLALVFLAFGYIYYVGQLSRWTPWDRLGSALLIFSLVEIAFVILYTYRYPHAIGVPNKGIYIAPALLGFGYLITLMGRAAGEIRLSHSRKNNILSGIAIACVAGCIILNAVLPVY